MPDEARQLRGDLVLVDQRGVAPAEGAFAQAGDESGSTAMFGSGRCGTSGATVATSAAPAKTTKTTRPAAARSVPAGRRCPPRAESPGPRRQMSAAATTMAATTAPQPSSRIAGTWGSAS